MADQNITMVRGDTMSFGFEYDGTARDLDSAYFACREGAALVFEKRLGDGITKDGTGSYVVRVAPEDTKELDAGAYQYDLQAEINDDVFTLFHGALILDEDCVRK